MLIAALLEDVVPSIPDLLFDLGHTAAADFLHTREVDYNATVLLIPDEVLRRMRAAAEINDRVEMMAAVVAGFDLPAPPAESTDD